METNSCCNSHHVFDSYHVLERWRPKVIRCLIVGESPGGSASAYFYDTRRKVRVRRNILFGLHATGLIESENLDAFVEGGFFFDHAIRCNIHPDEAARRSAKKYKYERCAHARHLEPLIEAASQVWVMGYVARNAEARLPFHSMLLKLQRQLSPPYVPG